MSDIEQLRARLDRLTGAARARPLLELVQLLGDAYWRAGPGQPAALPLLDQAIEAADEAYGYFQPDDRMRPNVAGLRGWLHATRHLAHFGPVEDRLIGLDQLQESLRTGRQPPMATGMNRLTLGQLHLSDVTRTLQSPNIGAMLMSGGFPAGAAAEVDQAVTCFEQVRDEPSTAREMREAAGTLLRMAGAIRIIVSGPAGSSSVAAINRIMEAMSVLQEIHREQTALIGLGSTGPIRSFYQADDIAVLDPLDRPVPMMRVEDRDAGRGSPTSFPPSPARPARNRPSPARSSAKTEPAKTEPAEPAGLRRELRARVSAGGDLFEALAALLDPAAPPPPADLVDDVVALAVAVVDSGAANHTDRLLLAVGLGLRARAAGRHRAGRDLDDAIDGLLTAAASPRPAPPEAVRVMRRLASMLDSLDPQRRAEARLAEVTRARPGRL